MTVISFIGLFILFDILVAIGTYLFSVLIHAKDPFLIAWLAAVIVAAFFIAMSLLFYVAGV